MAEQDYDEVEYEDVTFLFVAASAIVIFLYTAAVKTFRETYGMNMKVLD